jgi:DHA2 family multidrug resistance protein
MFQLLKNKTEMLPKGFLFKEWVPEWLIKITLFIVLLPSLVLFFLPMANINAAAGNTGSETYDVYFSVALFYAGYVSFFSLERRFFKYLAAKEYFIVITIIQIVSSYICYSTKEIGILFVFRFIQGMAFTMTVNLSLSLIYARLRTERARVIGYSVFFGMLVCMIPFNNFITAEIIDSVDFNIVYKCAMFSYLPSLVFLLLFMNNVRLDVKFPLYQLDWTSFLFYSIFLCLIGYIMVYGQEYYWFEDKRIYWSIIFIFIFGGLFILRQSRLKRPYFDLEVFRYRNFKIGALIIAVFYICRFAFSITTTYFITVLKLDPIHVGNITLINIFGIVIGVIISGVFVLQHRPIRLLWIYGFGLLLLYHAWMIFLFTTQANENNFYVPLLIQGLGVGTLMTPSIIFMVSSVPERLSVTSAGLCLFMRCFGFYISVGLMNYFELYSKSKHFNTFQDKISNLNPNALQSINKYKEILLEDGATPRYAAKAANKVLINAINTQNHIRYAIDYYEMICVLLIFTLLFIALFPFLNRTILTVSKNQPSPF